MTLLVKFGPLLVLLLHSVVRVFVIGALGLILEVQSRGPVTLMWRFALEKRMAKNEKAVAKKEAPSQLLMPQRLRCQSEFLPDQSPGP